MVLDNPREGKKVPLEGRDSKTVVDWLNGKARQRSAGGAVGRHKNNGESGGAGPSIYAGGWTTGRCISSTNTAKKLMPGPQREPEV